MRCLEESFVHLSNRLPRLAGLEHTDDNHSFAWGSLGTHLAFPVRRLTSVYHPDTVLRQNPELDMFFVYVCDLFHTADKRRFQTAIPFV